MPVIDAHQHFIDYTPKDYPWIGPDLAALARPFGPDDLAPLLARAGVDATVAVQARQSLAETRWLLDLTGEHDFLAGVVGWAPLQAPDLPAVLDELAHHPRLVGLRHVVHDEPDDDFILREDFNTGISLLTERNLVYDILIFARHLPQTLRFVDRHPNQPFVVDHLAKPPIAAGQLEPWATHLRELARRENVVCKLSGMVTEADVANWSIDDLRPFVNVVLDAFGPGRLMFGSDWPVCTVACDYRRWRSTVNELLADLSESEQQQILGGTAIAVYHLEPAP